MIKFLDLHIHSPYSRACSSKISLENIEKTCLEKGVDIIASGDFTHPAWFKEIKNKLEETDKKSGLYKLKKSDDKIKFILSTEISLIYKEKEKVRKIHLVILAPNIKSVINLNKYLNKKYNITSDGRPILGISAFELVKMCLKIEPKFLIFPAHIWTPWFSIFGSKSGFNSLEECFKDQSKHIYAYETGLSSDPAMNWRVSLLDNLTCLSNSDAHSLENIGREANIFNLKEVSYREIYRIIKEKDLKSLKGTIEMYPEEGMYYLNGHRDCLYSTISDESICKVCQKPLTQGVLSQVEKFARRGKNYKLKNSPPYYHLVSLNKIISQAINIKDLKSQKIRKEYLNIISNFGSEFDILLNIDLGNLKDQVNSRIIEGIKRVREKRLNIRPGYDGQYGKISIFN
jgi:uncharacterized protein (TIGR00375 family)